MGYGAGMTVKEAVADDEPDSNIPMNEIHVVSDEVYMPDELSSSPDGKFSAIAIVIIMCNYNTSSYYLTVN